MEQAYRFFVGVDWGNEKHQVHVFDEQRRAVLERSFEHSGAGLAQLADALLEVSSAEPHQIAVAIETPRGPVVETLLERGLHVYAINPKQLDRFRDRHSVAGAKDDRRDALVLADSLRTDLNKFRRIQLDDPLIVQLRILSRLHDELGEERTRLTNRLMDQLLRYFPSLLKLCPAANERWLWALLELAPRPDEAARLRTVKLTRLLRQHRIRRFTDEDLKATLLEPPLRVAPGVVEAAVDYVQSLLPRLRVIDEQQSRSDQRIERLLDKLSADEDSSGQKREHRDVNILRSLPGVGSVVAATMLAEASQPLAERDYHALRTQSGVAPVTEATGKRSGKRATVTMRYACNTRLRTALHYCANAAMQNDPARREHYLALRSRGHTHGRALRSVADSLLRMLVAMLKHQTPFEPSRPRQLLPASTAERVSA
jgi:transposase